MKRYHIIILGRQLRVSTWLCAALLLPVIASLTQIRYHVARAKQATSESLARHSIVSPAVAEVRAPVDGIMGEVLVAKGAAVSAGQPLAHLRDDALAAQVRVARAQLEALKARYGSYTLVSPVSGTVLRVYRKAGTIVPSGEPVMTIGDPSELVIAVPGNELTELPNPGQLVWVYSGDALLGTSQVLSVDADRITVGLPAAASLSPGQPVRVRFDPSTNPIITVPGLVTGDLVIIRAREDGRLSSVAALGQQVVAGAPVAAVERAESPDPETALAIAQTMEQLRQLEARIAALTIVAPESGVLTTDLPAVGTQVSAGETLGVIATTRDEIAMTVPTAEATLWSVGRQVIVESGNDSFRALVAQAEETGENINVVFTAPVGLGRGASATVLPALPSDAAVVPAPAVRNSRGNTVVATAGLVRVTEQQVTVLARHEDFVIVQGVKAGALVVTGPRLSWPFESWVRR